MSEMQENQMSDPIKAMKALMKSAGKGKDTVPMKPVKTQPVVGAYGKVVGEIEVKTEPSAELQKQLDAVPIVPGDLTTPQNELEQHVEIERQQGKAANNDVDAKSKNPWGHIFDKKDEPVPFSAEALFDESMNDKSADIDRFKAVYIGKVNECLGMTLDELDESIRLDHWTLFDTRSGIQGKMALRRELLKDLTVEERAKRLKDDFQFKPKKKVEKVDGDNGKAVKTKGGPKKPAFDPFVAVRKKLEAKFAKQGKAGDELKKLVDAEMKKFGA